MNDGLIRTRCPRCTSKLDVVTVRECQQKSVLVKVLELRCPNARCGYSVQDFDVQAVPTRPAGTPAPDAYASQSRWKAQHRDYLLNYYREYQARKKAEKAAAGN